MMDCTCPSIRCPIHGEPLPDENEIAWEMALEEELGIPEFIREHGKEEHGD